MLTYIINDGYVYFYDDINIQTPPVGLAPKNLVNLDKLPIWAGMVLMGLRLTEADVPDCEATLSVARDELIDLGLING